MIGKVRGGGRPVGECTGNAARFASASFTGFLTLLETQYRAVGRIGLARRLLLVKIYVGCDFRHEIARADQWRQQTGKRLAIAIFDCRLYLQLRIAAGRCIITRARQKSAILVDHGYIGRRQAGNRARDEIQNRLGLFFIQSRRTRQMQYHGCRRLVPVTQEYTRLLHCQMDARGQNAVDRFNRPGQIRFTGAAQFFRFNGPACSHRHGRHDRVTAGRRSRQSLSRQFDLRGMIIFAADP